MTMNIIERVSNLRIYLAENNLHAFIFPSTDPHQGEYIPEHWMTRAWISGFDGSAGTAVVTEEYAALWTDSRYFLAAENQLKNTPFILMKERTEGTPSITEWLGSHLKPGMRVGIDPTVNAFSTYREWKKELQAYDIELILSKDPAETLWINRPARPKEQIEIQPVEFSGKDISEKLTAIRSVLKEQKIESLLVSALDEIAWTLNLRGNDIHCNPVFLSYFYIDEESASLFMYKNNLHPEVAGYLQNSGVNLFDYEEINSFINNLKVQSISVNLSTTNCALVCSIPKSCRISDHVSPISLMKAVKNETEISGFRNAMIRDGVAMVHFLKWLKSDCLICNETELSISRKLLEFRKAQRLFRNVSFDTIAAYGAHGAIVHYEPDATSDIPLQNKGFLLLDSGAQYQDGTTDITRTIPLGVLTDDQKKDYTLVLKGHIALSRAVFPTGTTGTQLDICARYAMWQECINYGHGTGHGVGSYLNVHEGPHQIRMNFVPTPLQPGMTVTDEPGIYRPGKYGIRLENTLLVIPYNTTEFGSFLRFEPLTLCPFDKEPIIIGMLQEQEIEWINNYHQKVYEALSPWLDETHRTWLQKATSPLIK